MKAKELKVGMRFMADYSLDWRKHLKMPEAPEEFSIAELSIDDEIISFETGKINKYYKYICFFQKDGATICLNPDAEVVLL